MLIINLLLSDRLHWQIGDNRAADVCKFWGNNFDIGAMADGKGIGEAENGESKVEFGHESIIVQDVKQI